MPVVQGVLAWLITYLVALKPWGYTSRSLSEDWWQRHWDSVVSPMAEMSCSSSDHGTWRLVSQQELKFLWSDLEVVPLT